MTQGETAVAIQQVYVMSHKARYIKLESAR